MVAFPKHGGEGEEGEKKGGRKRMGKKEGRKGEKEPEGEGD